MLGKPAAGSISVAWHNPVVANLIPENSCRNRFAIEIAAVRARANGFVSAMNGAFIKDSNHVIIRAEPTRVITAAILPTRQPRFLLMLSKDHVLVGYLPWMPRFISVRDVIWSVASLGGIRWQTVIAESIAIIQLDNEVNCTWINTAWDCTR